MRTTLLPLLAFLLVAASPATDEARRLMDRGDEDGAFALIERNAGAGDADAVDYLAWFYDTGRHVGVDKPRAARLYREAAERGQRHAQWRLGVMLDMGEGVAEDPDEAFRWISRSAAQGSPEGNASMGVMYANGRGVARDYARSRVYYLESARLGSSAGFYGVGVLYAHGQGVAADPVEAGGWFIVATILEDSRSEAAMEALGLDPAGVRRATARAAAILREFGRDETVTFEEPPPRII